MRPWLLPVVVAALIVPITAAFMVGGPPAGLGIGAVATATLIVIGVRSRPFEPIEVAPSQGDRPRLLVLIEDALEDPRAAGPVVVAAEALEEDGASDGAEVLVLSPARNRPLAHWLSDVAEARLDAQRRLVLSLGTLAAAGVDARGEVGDPDPLQAVEDALRRFPADQVMVASAAGATSPLVQDLRARLAIPVSVVGVARAEGG
jgi:hypothetical protein